MENQKTVLENTLERLIQITRPSEQGKDLQGETISMFADYWKSFPAGTYEKSNHFANV